MKKLYILILTILLTLSLPVTALADSAKISVSGQTAKRGQMVYLTVSLSGCGKANTLGISMEYDSTALRKVASECTWSKKGMLQDFDVAKNNGVWAAKSAADLNGEVCTLAFRVQAQAPVGETAVTCKLTVKKDSKVLGTYTAKGTVNIVCDHAFGNWTAKDENLHGQECKYCGQEKTALHNWKNNLCFVCGWKKGEVVPDSDTSVSGPEDKDQTDQNQNNQNQNNQNQNNQNQSDQNQNNQNQGSQNQGQNDQVQTNPNQGSQNQGGQNQNNQNQNNQNQNNQNQGGQIQNGQNQGGQVQNKPSQNGQNQNNQVQNNQNQNGQVQSSQGQNGQVQNNQIQNNPNQNDQNQNNSGQNNSDQQSDGEVHDHEQEDSIIIDEDGTIHVEDGHVHTEQELEGPVRYMWIWALVAAAGIVILGFVTIKRK